MLEGSLLRSPAGKQWKKIGVYPHHGIAFPLFSLHSEKSSGIGEYPDLLPMIDFCKEVGMDVLQLLPLNDTGPDPSPYNGISAFALNPLFLGIRDLPSIEKVPDYQEKLAALHALCASVRIQYPDLIVKRKKFLREYFELVFKEISQTSDYKKFIEKHSWLPAYALFKAIKESQNWQPWETWPGRLRSPSEKQFEELLEEYRESVDYHTFLQYFCFRQMKEVKEAAQKKGVLLKGDVPILLSRNSADVWWDRHYFLLHMVAGSPPDAFAEAGQEWGFPLYDWQEMEKHRYEWWETRLKVVSEFYHLYRIDHVVGFFRIWAIPLGRKANEGAYLPADERMWIPQGKKIMKMMLEAAPLLPIGEDLGTVPDEVRQALTELGIPGTKVMRWERKWHEDRSFIPHQEYNPVSMTTVSTHDSDTIQLWWRHAPKEAKHFAYEKGWDYKPFLTLEQNEEILRDSHHSSSLFHINLLMEYLAHFPALISSNPQDERINVPGRSSTLNWTYRFRSSTEELLRNEPLKTFIRSVIVD